MDKPLTRWYCDVCGGTIDDVKVGYVAWNTNAEMKHHGFKVIHQAKCDRGDHRASMPLDSFLGAHGIAQLLAMLSIGPVKINIGQKSGCGVADLDQFVDFFRRVQAPYYEEGRRRFRNRDFLQDWDDANEVLPYLPDELMKIIKKYSEH